MNNVPFTLSQVRPIRDAMTVSRPSGLGYGVPVTWFSLGAGTSITPEYYDCTTLYLGGEGNGKFLLGVDGQEVSGQTRRSAVCTAENTVRHKNRQWNDLYRNHFEKGEFYHEQHHQGRPAHRTEEPHFL